MRNTQSLLVAIAWFISLPMDLIGSMSPPPSLPFHFLPACANTTLTTPTQHNTTVLLYDPTPSTDLCQCDVSSPNPFQLTRLWGALDVFRINVITPDDVTTLSKDVVDCEDSMKGEQRNALCYWKDSANLTLIFTPPAQQLEEEAGQGQQEKESQSATVLLAVQGDDAVHIHCREVAATPAVADLTTPSSSQGPFTPTLPPDPPSSNSTEDTTPTTINTTNPQSSASPTHSSSLKSEAATIPHSPVSGSQAGRVTTTTPLTSQHRESSGGVGMAVLAVGIVLMVLAVLITATIFITHRTRHKADVESAAASEKKGSGAGGPPSATASGKKTSQGNAAATGSCRHSLLNDNHNYEEVSDDGLDGVTTHAPHDRKVSNVSMPPAPYSHIKAIPTRSTTSHPRRNTTPTLPPASNTDNYNRLDLSRAARISNLQDQTSAQALYGDEDDQYMDINESDEADDDAGNDIYEAVDGDPERSPLCPRREAGGLGQLYTDCMSGQDGKIQICRDNTQSPINNPRLPNTQPDQRPLLPSSPPPKSGKNLHRNNSRSMDSLVRDQFRSKAQHRHNKSLHLHPHTTPLHNTPIHTTPFHTTPLHNTPFHTTPLHNTPLHTTPLDLHSNITPCQQRDLFLQQFRSQGDGAESTDLHPSESEYSDVQLPNPKCDPPSSDQHPQPPGDWPSAQTPSIDTPQAREHPAEGEILMRRKSTRQSKKKGREERASMVDQLKELNTGLLELESAVRHSMEIKDDELVMIDNIIYGTLPRNLSLPTTEL